MISQIFKDARAARPEVARLSDAKRNEILLALADAIAPEAEAILSANRMDCERMIISEEAAAKINATKRSGHKLVAVGVTVVRALETYVTTQHEVKANDLWTNKFIFPPYQFSIPDAYVSNFHLPESTMLMSVAAFGGYKNVMNAYKVALEEGYRFGPYGDAMLIL